MMSARSVFHSKVWHFNFSGNRTPVLPSLAISPLTVVLLQAGIKLWCFPKETWPPKPPRTYTIVPTLLQANEQWYRGSTLDRGKLSFQDPLSSAMNSQNLCERFVYLVFLTPEKQFVEYIQNDLTNFPIAVLSLCLRYLCLFVEYIVVEQQCLEQNCL